MLLTLHQKLWRCLETSFQTLLAKMSSEYDRRAAIIIALQAECMPAEIIDFLKLTKTTVYRVANFFHTTEGLEEGSATPDRKVQDRSGVRKKSLHFLEQLRAMIDDDPTIFMGNLVKKLNVSDWLLRKAMQEDLRCKRLVIS